MREFSYDRIKIDFHFHGGSFWAGVICTAVYMGLSPWWLLTLPLFLFGFPALRWSWVKHFGGT